MKAAAIRAYDALQAEYVADERAAARARGEVPRHADGTHSTVVRGFGNGTYRCRCSCGHEGGLVATADYKIALAEANAHRKTHKAGR